MGTGSDIGRILRATLPAAAIIIAASIIPFSAVCLPVRQANGDTTTSITESSRTYKDPVCNSMVKDLETEIAKTTASLKNCGTQSSASPKAAAARAKECEQHERKLKLTKENLLRIKEQCDKGLTPDYLPKVIEDPTAVPCAQCGANKSLLKEPPARVLTGLPMSGNVMDLKGGDPNLRSVFGKSAAAPALAAAGVPPPEFIGAWCCNNQFVEAANITAFYAKCCNICGEHCGTTPPVDPPPVDPPPVVVPPVEPPPVVVPPTEPPPPVVQPPTKGSGFLAKVGNFFKAIGKWIWDNVLKPIGDWVKSLFGKKPEPPKPEQEKCLRISKRIQEVEKIITGLKQGQKPEDIVSGGPLYYANTRCLPIVGAKTVYSDSFYASDPEIQEAVIAHENVHVQQCGDYGWLEYGQRVETEIISIETPAYAAEKVALERIFTGQCK